MKVIHQKKESFDNINTNTNVMAMASRFFVLE